MRGPGDDKRRATAAAGFTLLEVLLAIAIFALVAAMGYGAYTATLANVAAVEGDSRDIARGATLLSRMADEFGAAVLGPEASLHGIEARYEKGRRDEVLFLCRAPLEVDGGNVAAGGPVLVGYRGEVEGDEGLLTLYRTEQLVLPGDSGQPATEVRHLLAKGVRELRFSYQRIDGTMTSAWPAGGGGEGRQDDGLLPRAVRAELVFAADVEGAAPRRFTLLALLPAEERR